jgi:hypothetical protein
VEALNYHSCVKSVVNECYTWVGVVLLTGEKPNYRQKNLSHCYFMQDKFHVDSSEIEQNA